MRSILPRHGLPRRPFYIRYGYAVLFGALLLIAAKYLFGYLEVILFSVPLAAVAIFTLYLGAGAGSVLTVIVGIGIWFFFLGGNILPSLRDAAQLSGFFLASGIIVYSISLLERTRSRLQSALAEKEVLLKELYHRTKNNLQVVSSLISLQCSRGFDTGSIHSMCEDIQSRLKAMALVHEKLYRSGDLAHVNMRDYIEDLSRSIVHGYPLVRESLSLSYTIEDILLPIELVVPCGLIINELMSNSIKYAFPAGKGRINISMRAAAGEIELVYRDDGPGLPPEIDIMKTMSMGLRLVTALATKELKGTIDFIRNGEAGKKGGEFVIRFPFSRART